MALTLKSDALPTTGTASQFFNGSLQLTTFNTDAFLEVAGSNFFTTATQTAAFNETLSSQTQPSAAGQVVTGDTIINALNKMEGQLTGNQLPPSNFSGDDITDSIDYADLEIPA